MTKLTILIVSWLMVLSAQAVETCSRVATINYQEVLVDVSSKNKGEGLRYYLQKDPVSKSLLDEYQQKNQTTWKSAALSTLGTGMVIAGLIRTNDGKNENFTGKNFLIFGGLGTIIVSYFVAKTIEVNNETILNRSVEEYNKRNTPRIFFAPSTDFKSGTGMGVGVGQEF